MTSRISQAFTLLERYVAAFEDYTTEMARMAVANTALANSHRKRNEVLNDLDRESEDRAKRSVVTIEGIESRLDAIDSKLLTAVAAGQTGSVDR